MFAVDGPPAEAIRRLFNKSGELSAVVELHRHLPVVSDNEQARACVRTVASWKPLPRSLACCTHRPINYTAVLYRFGAAWE
jgi:hypothetical protein